MPLSPEDEEFRKRRLALAPEAEPPVVLPPDPAILPVPEIDESVPAVAPAPAPPPRRDPYGPGADRAALEAAIQDRRNADAGAAFLDAATLFNRAGGGHAGDLAASARAQRDDSFNDVMRRRALADQDAAAAKRAREAELDAAMRDARSDLSLRARGLFAGSTVGKALRERMGDQFDALSASQLPGARDIVGSETNLLKASAKAGNGAGEDRAGALDALVAAAGGDESARGKFFRQAFATAPLKVIKDQGFGLLNREEKQRFEEKMQGVRDAAAKTRAQIMAGVNVEKELRGDRADLGKILDKAGAFFPNAKIIDALIAKHTDAQGNVTGLPTVGPLEKPATDFWGGLLRSPEGQELAKAADQIQLAYRNLVTGSAASTEEDRRIAAAGLDRRNLQGFLTGFKLMKDRYKDLLQRTYGSYEPEVAQGYISRNPDYGIAGDPVYDPAVAKEAFRRYEQASQGQHLIPGRRAAPPVPTSTPVQEPRRLRMPDGSLWEEGPDGEAVQVEE